MAAGAPADFDESRRATRGTSPGRAARCGIDGRQCQGLTLIELMVVVAIVSILAGIAIPAYLDYVARSKVSEALTSAGACTTSISEFYQNVTRMPANTIESGCATLATTYVQSVSVAQGRISLTLQAIDATRADGKILGFQPYCGAAACNPGGGSGPITAWHCDAARAGSTVDDSFLPAVCR